MIVLMLYLALVGECWQCNVLLCNGTCNYVLQHRYEKSLICLKPRGMLSFALKQGKKSLLIQIQLTLIQPIKNQTEGPISPCPPEQQPFVRHDGICGLEMIWAGEVGAKKRAHPPPPPPAPRYKHG